MVGFAQISIFGRWSTTVLALVCIYLIDSSQSVGVVARLRDKLAPLNEVPDKTIGWNRWAWLTDEGNHLAKSIAAAKRAAFLNEVEAAEAEEKEKPVQQPSSDDPDHERALEENDEAIVEEENGQENERKEKRNDAKTGQSGKRGRLNRPVIHAG